MPSCFRLAQNLIPSIHYEVLNMLHVNLGFPAALCVTLSNGEVVLRRNMRTSDDLL